MPTRRHVTEFSRLRSLLFAPAVRPDFLAKLGGRQADAIVIDCEDATPANDDAKAEARRNAAEWVPRLQDDGATVVVRVNAVPTRWFADDVAEALSYSMTAAIVPKVESVEQMDAVAEAFAERGIPDLGVMVGIETALGVADARAILAHHQVNSAYFGAEDFIADMGGVRTDGNAEVAFARAQVALAARLAGVPALDQVVTDFRNDERFVTEAAQARAMGYAGKLCIHPGQVALANEQFMPSVEEVERARRLLDAYEAASTSGIAAIDFEGQMVDEPLAAHARRVIELADPV